MEQKEQNFNAGGEAQDSDATIVTPAPFFDDEATQVAQPVVPLTPQAAAVAAVPDEILAASHATPEASLPYGAHSVASRGTARAVNTVGARRSWPIALIVISILVGSVLGSIGLSFYQKRQAAKAAAATMPSQEPVANEAAQPATTVEAQTADQTASLPAEAPATIDESDAEEPDAASQVDVSDTKRDDDTDATRTASPARHDADDADKRARKSESDARKGADQDEPRKVVKRERKSDGEEDNPRGEVRARRVEDDETEYINREARRIDRLERRRARRERMQRGVDSVRGIFEGQPPQ